MKAIRVHAFGTPDDVILDEIERPTIGSADALVQVECASVNPLDVKILTGLFVSGFRSLFLMLSALTYRVRSSKREHS